MNAFIMLDDDTCVIKTNDGIAIFDLNMLESAVAIANPPDISTINIANLWTGE